MSQVKIKVWIETNVVNSRCSDTIEVDAEEWAAMSEDERDSYCREVAFNNMEWGYEEQS